MITSLFLITLVIYTAAEFQADSDAVLYQSDQNSQHVWHSYTFDTGAGNREELHLSKVKLSNDFESAENVSQWKSLQVQGKVVIVGFGANFLIVTTFNNNNDTYTYKEELQESIVGLSMFQKWDALKQGMESFVVVAVNNNVENVYVLKWYKIHSRKLMFLWDWPVYRIVTFINVINVNQESKLLIASHKNGTDKNPSVDIYNFKITSYLDIWLFEKIFLEDIPSAVEVFSNYDNTFLSVSFPIQEMIHIFRYKRSLCSQKSDETHYFLLHQKISSLGLKSIISFHIDSHWYLAVASKNSTLYEIRENLFFYPVNNFNLGTYYNWLSVPINTYREDVMLLSDSGSDLFLITWTGNENAPVIESFSKLACGNDTNCSEKLRGASLKNSASFFLNGHQYVLLSNEHGNSLLFELLVQLKPLQDKITLKLDEILGVKNTLEKKHENQNKQIKYLAGLNNKKLKDGFSVLNEEVSKRISKEVFFSPASNKSAENLEIFSSTKNWTEILIVVNNLKATLNSTGKQIENFKSNLKNISFDEEEEKNYLPNNVTERISFYGDVLIDELNLLSLNGHDVNYTLRNSFRKDKNTKIGGRKTLKNISAENILVEKIGETLACDIVFSDDAWEGDDKNIINGDIIWEGKLHVLNDLTLLPEKTKANTSSSSKKMIPQIHKDVFEQLYFETLEITEKTFVQKSMNGQPLILPVHLAPLDIHYLDSVNQARVELVNVKNSLEVDFLNGKNFSELMEKVITTNGKPLFGVTKIDGVFTTHNLQANEINGISLPKTTLIPKASESMSNFNERYLDNNSSLNAYAEGSNLKSSQTHSLKRNIHVFQDLEIKGVLVTDKINNISWTYLNSTVRKNEKIAKVTGLKNFQKSLSTEKVNLSGTLNGRFVNNIMTKSSDQVVRFPQIFDDVVFKNLRLEGSWDGVCLKCLNQSVIRLFPDDVYASNLTFTDKYELFSDSISVTDFVNGVSINDKELNSSGNVLEGESIKLKSIKALKVILNGSLNAHNKVNDMNLTHFDQMRVSLKYPQTVQRDISFLNVTVFKNLNASSINNNDIFAIMNSESDTNWVENFLQGKTNRLKKLLVKGLVNTSNSINGFNLKKIADNGICITKPSYFNGSIEFEKKVQFSNINATNSINNISLKKLEKDIVFKHSHVFIRGVKNFSTIAVMKDMKARSLNGHLIQVIVSLKGDQTMKSPVKIKGDVIIQGNVTSYGSINDIAVPDLLKKYSTQYNSHIITEDLELLNEMITIDNLIVDGNVQNVSFDAVINDVISKEGSFNITGKKIFTGEVKFQKNVVVEGSMNGKNLTELFEEIVFVNQPQKIGGKIKIDDVVFRDLEVENVFNSSLINNFDSNEWLEDSIPLDRYEMVDGKKHFEEAHVLQNVQVDFINGHLPSAAISLKGKQYIPSLGVFPRINLTSDLSVAGFINGKNLMAEYQKSIMVTGDQTINGKMVFNNQCLIRGNLYVDVIKGKDVGKLITLDTEQVIKSNLEFSGLVVARKNVEDLKIINDIDLNTWNQKSVGLNRDQVLNGFWTVRGTVKAKNIDGEGLLGAMSLPNFTNDIENSRMVAFENMNDSEVEHNMQCQKLKQLSKQFSQMPYVFHQFEVAHLIVTHSIIESVITFKINNIDYLIVTFVDECLSKLYKWDEGDFTYIYLRQINIGLVSKWMVAYRNNSTYLITSSLRNNVDCEKNLQQGNVWVFEDDPEKYVHLLTSNGFIDIIQENSTCGEFFTLDEKGAINRWTIEANSNVYPTFLMNVGQENFRFIDFSITGGLAISNGKEIKQIRHAVYEIKKSHLPFTNAQTIALPIDGKTFVGLVLKDKIVIYDNITEEKVFSVIHTYKAGSVMWFQCGFQKQAFLIFASHHKLIEVYEYKSRYNRAKILVVVSITMDILCLAITPLHNQSLNKSRLRKISITLSQLTRLCGFVAKTKNYLLGVSGLIKKASIQMFSSRLQSVELPSKHKYQLHKFVIVIQKKKIIFLEADMMGDYFVESDSLC